MLHVPFLTRYNFRVDNWGANPLTTPGTSVIPGASNAEGSWTQIFSAAAVSQDVSWIIIDVYGGNTANQIKSHLLDIGVDPAGGTSYTPIISNIVCGASANSNAPCGAFTFPIRIKAGSTIAARVQGSNATAGTVRVVAVIYGQPSAPESDKVGSYSETIGTITNSEGVSFTPGNATDGSWVLLGTTTRSLWWWNLCVQISNATMSAHGNYIELAYGDASNKHSITRVHFASDTSEFNFRTEITSYLTAVSYCHLPAGTNIYIRGECSAAPVSGYNAVAVGVGG